MKTNLVLVCYDVPKSKLRNKVIACCRSHGLLPIQYSICAGELTQTRRKELVDEIKLILHRQQGHVAVLPIDKRMSEQLVSIGIPMVQSVTFWSQKNKELVL